MKIVVLDGFTLNPGDNPWAGLDELGELIVYDRTEDGDILARAAGADVLLTNKTPLTAETMGKLPDLKFISVLATGYNVVDTQAARRQGISISNVPEYSTDSVAQLVFAYLLELCHRARHHDSLVKAGRWADSIDFCFWDAPLVELAGKKMGIVGFGRIGRRVGELANAFGMEVLACNRSEVAAPSYKPFAFKTLAETFAESDVVSLHCPLTDTNAEMVNAELLATMKSSAILINTGRGPLVNEADLAEALDTGRIAAAAVDVTSTEPPKSDNPLLSAKNILITPHIAWATLEARKRLMQTSCDNVRAFIDDKPINVVN